MFLFRKTRMKINSLRAYLKLWNFRKTQKRIATTMMTKKSFNAEESKKGQPVRCLFLDEFGC